VAGGGNAADGRVGAAADGTYPPGISTWVSHRVSAEPDSGVAGWSAASPASAKRAPHPAQKGAVPVRGCPHVAQKLMPACLFQLADG
jgi:hypothetical protein